MTTILDLMNLFEMSYNGTTPTIYVSDKTGGLDFGTFRKGDNIPEWLCYVGVENFKAGRDYLSVRLKDFRGDVYTRNDDFNVFVLGFDYAKEAGQNGVYYPEYINVKATHYARCEEKVKKLKLTPESFGGYSFKIYGKKYTMRDVI